MTAPTFTGLRRRRTTRRGVVLGDRLAKLAITLGGFGTVAAVSTVFGFLVWVVLPLFTGSGATAAGSAPVAGSTAVQHVELDPYRQVAWHLDADGHVRAHALADGTRLADQPVFAPDLARGWQVHDGIAVAAGKDGAVHIARIDVATQRLEAAAVPPAASALPVGAAVAIAPGLCERTADGARVHTLRVQTSQVDFAGGPLLLADLAVRSDGETIAALTEGRRLLLRATTQHTNEITEAVVTETATGELQLPLAATDELPQRLVLTGRGDTAWLCWTSGRVLRIDARDVTAARVAETFDLLPDTESHVQQLGLLLGRNTVLVGDDHGRVHSFFRARPPQARGSDGSQIERAHTYAGPAARVVDLAASARSRLFVVAYADGTARVFHATSERLVASVQVPAGETLQAIALAPKEDALVLATDRALHQFSLQPGHAEFSVAAVARPVFYEGYEHAAHVWQSTGGTDDFEPKFGLWPLVFGTLKATGYCLLFGVPLALLAALYTSEFLHPRQRARVKPCIELMASLPSVVLGFLAALVIAPWVERALPTLLAAVFCVPFTWLLASQLQALLPSELRLRLDRARLLAVLATLLPGVLLSHGLGLLAEATLFGGDLRRWLDDRSCSAFGGWWLALLPVAAVAIAFAAAHSGWRRGHPRAGLDRLLVGGLASLALAACAAALLTLFGLDLRDFAVGTYVQRNALVVGIVMGFAVVPIIYTIAEDALAAVPEHLRAASLGAGATPWQTAIRVILPTAMSGIFSAVMVGLGRAVGETMIVLMAAGNTPVLDLNPFNGFRTLSANIAVELPEAVRDSTHYRILYLAALVLFALTFVLNTGAELVRQRFRRRAFQL